MVRVWVGRLSFDVLSGERGNYEFCFRLVELEVFLDYV